MISLAYTGTAGERFKNIIASCDTVSWIEKFNDTAGFTDTSLYNLCNIANG